MQVEAEYYENGQKITVIKGFSEITPRNANLRSSCAKYSTKYASLSFNQQLRIWCALRKGRMQDLARLSAFSESWYSKRRYGSHVLKQHHYAMHVLPAMHKIEEIERQKGGVQ